jgi:hypothetical protein
MSRSGKALRPRCVARSKLASARTTILQPIKAGEMAGRTGRFAFLSAGVGDVSDWEGSVRGNDNAALYRAAILRVGALS